MGRPKGSKNKSKVEKNKIAVLGKQYVIHLEVNGEKRIAKSNELEKSILELKLNDKPFTKGIFTLEYEGKSSRPVSFFIWQLRRLWEQNLSGQIQRAILMKRLLL